MSSGGGQQQSASNQITGAGSQAYAEAEMTPEEQQQYQQSFGTGNLINQAMQYQMGGGQMPSGYQSPTQQYLQQTGPLGQAAYGQVLQNVQNPYANYQSALQPSLQLAQNTVNENAQQRGLLQSGIDIGNMGEAGVQLAVANAQNMMQQYQQNLQNAGYASGQIQNTGQQNLSNLNQLYNQQQGYGQQSMNRQANAAFQNAQYQAYPGQAQLGNYYGQQAGNQQGMYGLAGAGLGAAGNLGAASILGGSQVMGLGAANALAMAPIF